MGGAYLWRDTRGLSSRQMASMIPLSRIIILIRFGEFSEACIIKNILRFRQNGGLFGGGKFSMSGWIPAVDPPLMADGWEKRSPLKFVGCFISGCFLLTVFVCSANKP